MYRLSSRTSLGSFAVAFFLVVGLDSAHAQTAQEIAKKAFGSTVLLVTEDANSQPLSFGSGFFVGDGEIASNLHVVEGAVKGYAKLVGEKVKYEIEGITAIDAERDLVLLKISGAGSRPLTIGDSDTVQVGDSVYAVGNPQGLEGTFSQGIVSSIRNVGADKVLQITAPISPGSSGGPVLNVKGDVVGVSVATFREGQNLNFAIPSNYLNSLLAKDRPKRGLWGMNVSDKKRSVLADFGGRATEGVVGTQFLWGYVGSYTFSLRNQLRDTVNLHHASSSIPDSMLSSARRPGNAVWAIKRPLETNRTFSEVRFQTHDNALLPFYGPFPCNPCRHRNPIHA